MTIKEQALRAIQALPDDATIEDAIAQLRRVSETADQLPAANSSSQAEGNGASASAGGGVWTLLGSLAGTVSAPEDWAAQHDHYVYGTPKRSSAD